MIVVIIEKTRSCGMGLVSSANLKLGTAPLGNGALPIACPAMVTVITERRTPKKSPIMFGAVLATPAAAPTPSWANRSAVVRRLRRAAGAGSRLPHPCPVGHLFAVEPPRSMGCAGRGGRRTRNTRLTASEDLSQADCGQAASSPAANVTVANRPHLQRVTLFPFIFPPVERSGSIASDQGRISVTTMQETPQNRGFVGMGKPGLVCLHRLAWIIC